jgi:type II secretory pathway component PulJ
MAFRRGLSQLRDMRPRHPNRLACSPRRRQSARGFTLIEVLVAVV